MQTTIENTIGQTAENIGVKLIDESLTSLRAGNTMLEVAVLAGVPDISATEYHRGVDTALVQFRGKGNELVDGIYTLRVTAIDEIRERGKHPAIVEMVDANGKVASRQRVSLEVFSVEVPTTRTFDQAVFSLESRFREDMLGRFDPSSLALSSWCSNGVHIIDISLA